MWDLPGPGLEPMSPALAGGFLTTAPPGKSLSFWIIVLSGYMPRSGIAGTYDNSIFSFLRNLYIVNLYYFFFPSSFGRATQHADLSSLTRDWTCAPCSGSAESQPLDRQGNPCQPVLSSTCQCIRNIDERATPVLNSHICLLTQSGRTLIWGSFTTKHTGISLVGGGRGWK